jgi:hypothetical protein
MYQFAREILHKANEMSVQNGETKKPLACSFTRWFARVGGTVPGVDD